MEKIKGIKTVDINITAKGKGVVNFNTSIEGEFGKSHSFPKMIGVSPYIIKSREDGGKFGVKGNIKDIDLSKASIYVSANCIRHELFRDEMPHHTELSKDDAPRLLASIMGLIRGYAIADGNPLMRKSPLAISDLVTKSNDTIIPIEIRSKTGARDEDGSIHSSTSQGEVEYEGSAIINIDEIQFISLDNVFGRAAAIVTQQEGESVAKAVQSYISGLDLSGRNVAVAYGAFRRKTSEVAGCEWGILLNDGAIDVLVDVIIDKFKNLQIIKTKGKLWGTELNIKYNSGRYVEDFEGNTKQESYAIYYRPATTEEISAGSSIKDNQGDNRAEKEKKKAEKKAKREAKN